MSTITEQMILDIKVLGARQAALEAKMVNDEVGNVGSTAEDAGKSAEKSSAGFLGMGGSLKSLAKIAGAVGLAFGFKDIIDAGVEWQKQQVQLQGALQKTGTYSKSTMDTLESAAKALSQQGGFTSIENIGAMQEFIQETGKSSNAVKELKDVTDLARGSGLSFSTAQKYMQMALAGSTGRLNKYLGPLTAVTTRVDYLTAAQKKNYTILNRAEDWDKQQTALMIMDKIQQKYGGDTARYNKTAAGAVSNLHNAIQDLAETMGQKLLPIVSKIVQFMANFITRHQTAMKVLLALIAVGLVWESAMKLIALRTKICAEASKAWALIQKAWLVVQKLWTVGVEAMSLATATFSGSEEAATAASLGLAAALDTIGIGEIIQLVAVLALGIYELIKHFKAVKDAVVKAFTDIYNFLKPLLIKIWGVISGPFQKIVSFVKMVVGDIISFFSSLPSKIAKLGVKIWNGLKNGLLDALKWILHQITSLPGKILHGIKSLAHTLSFGLFNSGGVVGKTNVPRKRFASGGMIVPGIGNTDTVPALLTPGEGVLSVAAMKAINSRGFGIPTVQTGGTNVPEVIATGPIHNVIMMDTRQVAEQIGRYALKIAARR